LTPAPRYFELFSRRVMPDNWDGHGDQVGLLGEKPLPAIEAEAPAAKPKRKPRTKPAEAPIDTAPAAEPTLPGIAPPDFGLDAAELVAIRGSAPAADVRRSIDDKATRGEFVEVRINSHPALWEAFDKISHDAAPVRAMRPIRCR
jgi:hypothetical protein